jgi:hypothetical protein
MTAPISSRVSPSTTTTHSWPPAIRNSRGSPSRPRACLPPRRIETCQGPAASVSVPVWRSLQSPPPSNESRPVPARYRNPCAPPPLSNPTFHSARSGAHENSSTTTRSPRSLPIAGVFGITTSLHPSAAGCRGTARARARISRGHGRGRVAPIRAVPRDSHHTEADPRCACTGTRPTWSSRSPRTSPARTRCPCGSHHKRAAWRNFRKRTKNRSQVPLPAHRASGLRWLAPP